MAAPMIKTRTPGVFKRGSRYVVTFRDASGEQRKESARTYDEARDLKRKRDDEARRGVGYESKRDQVTLAQYATDLFGTGTPGKGRFQGRRGAVRDSTLADYKRDLERHWLPKLGKQPLARINAPAIKRVIDELAARDGDAYLADRTLKRLTAPLSALFATAVEEGVTAHNIVRDVRLPSGRDRLRRFDEEDDDADDPSPGKARTLTAEQISSILLTVDPRWKPLFWLLAGTGLRISEALALRWRDLKLDGDHPIVQVRRAYTRGEYGPGKSDYARRDVDLPFLVVRALREHRAKTLAGDDDLAFPSSTGTVMSDNNLRRRVLAPATAEAGCSWAGFHAFRHTVASRAIAEGRNIVKVSRMLGHHAPSFTLNVYAHLMEDGTGGPLDLDGFLKPSGNQTVTEGTGLDGITRELAAA